MATGIEGDENKPIGYLTLGHNSIGRKKIEERRFTLCFSSHLWFYFSPL